MDRWEPTVQFEPATLPLQQPFLMRLVLHNPGPHVWFRVQGRLRSDPGILLLSPPQFHIPHVQAKGQGGYYFWVQGRTPGTSRLILERLRIEQGGRVWHGARLIQKVEVRVEDAREVKTLWALCTPRHLEVGTWTALKVHLFNTGRAAMRVHLKRLHLEAGKVELRDAIWARPFVLPPGKSVEWPLTGYAEHPGLAWLRIQIHIEIFEAQSLTVREQVLSVPLQARSGSHTAGGSGTVVHIQKHTVRIGDIVQTGKGNVLFGSGGPADDAIPSVQRMASSVSEHTLPLKDFSWQQITQMVNTDECALDETAQPKE